MTFNFRLMITPGIETGLLTVHCFPRSYETLTLFCQERNMDVSSPSIPVCVIRSGNLVHRKVPILPRERPEDKVGFVLLPILAAPWVGDLRYPDTKELKAEMFSFLRKTAFPRHILAGEMQQWLLESSDWGELEIEPLARWPAPEDREDAQEPSGNDGYRNGVK